MKKLLNILWIIVLQSIYMIASTRGDVKIIEASENIRYLGQKITKEYLYFYQNPQRIELKEQLYENLKLLEQSILDIKTIANNKESKNILDFLTYNKNDVKKLINKSVSKQKAILMLDYSESFLEGANSIENSHKYKFSNEEQILMSLKDIEYLLQRISKYYMAYILNIDKQLNFNNMSIAISRVEEILKEINSYNYPKKVFMEVKEMNSNWIKHKNFLYKVKELSIPNLILLSTTKFENSIKEIALYHKQNQ